MSRPKDLTQPVQADTAAEAFLEATLPVHYVHREGDARRALALLREDPEVARANVWTAAAAGETRTMAQLLQADPPLANARGGTRNWEPLLYLCFSRLLREPDFAERMLETARLLIEHGADPNCYWLDPQEALGNRETPLYGAAGVANHVELARLLIESGADPNDGETSYHMVEHEGVPCAEFVFPKLEPIHRGAALGHQLDYDDLAGLRKLLELGADPNGPTPFDNLPLHQAVWRGRSRAFFELLVEYGANPNAPNKKGKTPYALAARYGRGEIMQWLVELGASTEIEFRDRFLSACALADEPAARQLLAERPGLLGELSSVDRASICEAAAAGNTEGVRLMLDLGWDLHTRGNVWSETPLHRAALAGHLETVRFLVERGADLTIRDRSYDSSPLGWALHEGHAEVARFLCGHPQRLDLRDAVECGHTGRVLQLLADTDVDAAIGRADRGVLLRAAAGGGNRELVEALLKRGADPGLRNREGLNAADAARARGHDAIAKLLETESEA